MIFDSGGVHMFYSSRFSAQLIGNKCHSPTHTREREKSRERERKRERQMGSVKITVSWSIVDERVL